jgi:hypothetical protein
LGEAILVADEAVRLGQATFADDPEWLDPIPMQELNEFRAWLGSAPGLAA